MSYFIYKNKQTLRRFLAFFKAILSGQYKGEYSFYLPYEYKTYSPWFVGGFKKFYDSKIRSRTMVTEDRCYIIKRFCEHCFNLNGDFVECGVYKGGSAYLIAETMKSFLKKKSRKKKGFIKKKLYLFDTFKGMPATVDPKNDSHKKGDFSNVFLDKVRNYLKEFNFIELKPGFIPNTFKGLKSKKFAFVHVDVDIYQTTKDCCRFFYPRMTKSGVLIFDDYGFKGYKNAEKKAVDEFFKDKPESLIVLPTGQGIIIKA